MKKIIKDTIYFYLVLILFSPSIVKAGSVDNMLWGGYQGNIQTTSGHGNTDPRETAGSEEGAEIAKKTLMAGMIGLVVVLASYGIAQFVINRFYIATGATG